jgi:hypothetical protein
LDQQRGFEIENTSVIPEGAGPVNPQFVVLIFVLAVLRQLVGAPG